MPASSYRCRAIEEDDYGKESRGRSAFADSCRRRQSSSSRRTELGSFTFITKSPPAAVLLKKAANIASGSKTPGRETVAKVNRKQLEEIAKTKEKDLNAKSLEAAVKVIAGTARSMGIEVVDEEK